MTKLGAIVKTILFPFCLVFAMQSIAQGRVALVIGNSDYDDGALRNPTNDARDISKTFRDLGFEVDLILNASQEEMVRSIHKFSRKLQDDSIGVFYYSGHALQFEGRNYLVPVDSQIDDTIDIRFRTVSLSEVFDRVRVNNNALKLIVIDASRENPFQKKIGSLSNGLAHVNAPSSTIVVYSSAPGTVAADGNGRNSLFARAFIKGVNKPGIHLDRILKEITREVYTKTGGEQIPWTTSSLSYTFYFSPRKNANVSQELMVVVDVFYGTDRRKNQSNPVSTRYGSKMGNFDYGIAEVSIPRSHKLGELESPVWWKFEFRADPERHIVLMSLTSVNRSSFFQKMKDEMKRMPNNNVFVFIHGFNVTFEESIRRTAQLAYDLQYPGIPVAYSWPSQGSPGPIDYATDKERSEWSYPHLKQFLVEISEHAKPKRVHILAHSMGNKLLANAIKSIGVGDVILNQVILAAPDINSKIFVDHIAPFLERKAERYSLYTSSHDKALILANEFQKSHRLGQSGEEIVVLKGIDTIDASGIDTSVLGHSYYGDERELLFDLYHLIKNNLSPEQRNLEKKNKGGLIYWRLRQ